MGRGTGVNMAVGLGVRVGVGPGVAMGVSVGGAPVSEAEDGTPDRGVETAGPGVTDAVGSPSPPPPPVAKTTPATATITTTTSPMAAGITGKRRAPAAVGRLSTWRTATSPSFSMKNCSWPCVPVKAPCGRRDKVTS